MSQHVPRDFSPFSPLRLSFSNHTEFLAEVAERGPNLEAVIRVTFRKTADPSGASIVHLTLLATYLRSLDEGQPVPTIVVVQLAEPIGSIWSGLANEESERTRRHAEELRGQVVAAIEALGYRVGGGAYTIPSAR